MSTHMIPPHSARNMTAMDQEITQEAAASQAPTATEADNSSSMAQCDDTGGEQRVQESGQAEKHNVVEPDSVEAMQESSETSFDKNQASSLIEQPSASVASLDLLSTSNSNLQPTFPTQSLANDPTGPTEAHEYSLYSPPSNEQASTAEDDTEQAERGTQEDSNEATANEPVNYQALLDKIVPPDPPTEVSNSNIATGNSHHKSEESAADPSTSSSTNFPSPNSSALAGLPPRPPPQEYPAIHPNYVPGEDIRSYHYPHLPGNQNTQPTPQSSSYRSAPSFPPNSAPGSNGLPPPPIASFQQPNTNAGGKPHPQQTKHQKDPSRKVNKGARDDDAPWAVEVQVIYDKFLDDEAVYTAEGTWDKFPQGSRLFVGNLPTEIVTKRDIFHIFYRYGRLAQISIKQAYGFVQFMDTESSHKALRAEQGGKIKDRTMHLEISKPPKNSRNAQSSAAGDRLRAGHYRRSRSPDRPMSRAGRGGDRFGRKDSFNDFRDERRGNGREDFRSRRSPSPRAFRGRDNHRGSPDRYVAGSGRDRSRSPYGRGPRFDRGPSPRRRSPDDDDDRLPMPKRAPRDVPEVQLILMDDLDRNFVAYIEKHLRDRGLAVGTLQMPHNFPIDAIVKRQVVEGVQAIIKVFRAAQITAKIPVQLFDRSGGGNQARFETYDDLDANIAAELILRNKQKQPPIVAVQPQYGQQKQTEGVPPNLSSLITQLDGPTLQKLMGALQSNPQTPQSAPLQSSAHNQDYSAMLGSLAQQQSAPHSAGPSFPQHQGQQQSMPPQYQQQGMPTQHQIMPQQPQAHPQQQYPYAGYQPPPQQQLAQQQQPPQQQYIYQQGAQPPQHQVQDIMQQLAKWKQ